MRIVSITFFFSIVVFYVTGQNWVIYNTQNSGLPANEVLCIAQDHHNNKWIGTYWGGVAKFTNSQWTVYTDTNSAMPHYSVRAIAIDINNDKWFGTPSGLVHFDGTNFTIYNTGNSPLPSDFINLIRVDSEGNKWIGTNSGLAKFDGQNWEVFTTSNSTLPSNYIQCLEIEEENNDTKLWIGTYGGLVRYEIGNNDWEVFTTSNAPFEDNIIYSLGITGNGNGHKIWVRTYSEVLRYNGQNWMVYDQYNLGLPNSFCRTITSTDSNSLWVGGDEGLVKLNHNNGDVSSENYFNSFNSGLPNNGIITLFSDLKKNLWIGVALGNLVVYNPSGVDLTSVAEQELAGNLSIYPVPATDKLTVNFELDNNETVLMETMDISGRKIISDIYHMCTSGSNKLLIQTEQFLPGIYFIRLSSGERATSLKIIKQ